jgi:hypothetical protein
VADDSEILRRNPETAFRAVGDEGGLVVIPADSIVQVLNPVGSKIYSLLDGKHSRAQIVRAIVDEFEVSEAQARADLEGFLAELRSRGMLAGPAETPDAGNGERR